MTKILGIPGKWFPTSDLVAGVMLADHRYGAEASVSISTDYYFDMSMYWGEMLFFKHNLKATCFINSDHSFYKDAIPLIEKTGKIHHDLYFMTDKWVNPISGVYETIPDYYSPTWTSAGATVFENAAIGQPKPTGVDGSGSAIISTRYPSHGQQLYDVSGGQFGYNFPSHQVGLSNLSELIMIDQYIRWGLEDVLGRKISTCSYRNGITAQRWLLKEQYLGARNSAGRISGAALTSYGFSQKDQEKLGDFFYTDAQIVANPDLGWTEKHHLNRQNTVQYEACLTAGGPGGNNYLTSHSNFIAYLTTLLNGNGSNIKNLFGSGGWFQEFTHWHNMYQGTGWAGTKGDIRNLYEDYLSTLSDLLAGHFVFKGGYGEIVEYHKLRDAVKRVDIYKITANRFKISVRVEDMNEMINTPITVIIDLTGSEFEGREFRPVGQGCKGIRKVTANIFAVDVLYEGTLEVDGPGQYYDFSKPMLSATKVEGIIEWFCDKNVKIVVYGVDHNGFVTQMYRQTNLAAFGTIEIGTTDLSIKIGAVSKEGTSVLIDVS